MTKIIELAHALGEEIAKSDEIKNLEAAKKVWEENDYLGLGWSKKDVDDSYAKLQI